MRPFTEKLWRECMEVFDDEDVEVRREIGKKVIESRKALCDVFGDGQKELFEKYEQCELEHSSWWEYEAFRRGFDLGVRIITEVYVEKKNK